MATDGPLRKSDGVMLAGRFYSWEDFDVTPNEQVRPMLAQERKRAERRAGKKAEKAKEQADTQAERLERLKASADAKAPRWMKREWGWTWHVYDPEHRGFVDTGLKPGPRGLGYPPTEEAA